jgi:hypothetical protein
MAEDLAIGDVAVDVREEGDRAARYHRRVTMTSDLVGVGAGRVASRMRAGGGPGGGLAATGHAVNLRPAHGTADTRATSA